MGDWETRGKLLNLAISAHKTQEERWLTKRWNSTLPVCCQSHTWTGLWAFFFPLLPVFLTCGSRGVSKVFWNCKNNVCYKASPVCSFKFRLVIPTCPRCRLNLDPEQSRWVNSYHVLLRLRHSLINYAETSDAIWNVERLVLMAWC